MRKLHSDNEPEKYGMHEIKSIIIIIMECTMNEYAKLK